MLQKLAFTQAKYLKHHTYSMALISILLKNDKSKTCLKMLFLREDTELLISENVNAINRKNASSDITISTIEPGFSTKELEREGWITDDGLYDRLILEYNNDTDVKHLLTRWR